MDKFSQQKDFNQFQFAAEYQLGCIATSASRTICKKIKLDILNCKLEIPKYIYIAKSRIGNANFKMPMSMYFLENANANAEL